MSQHKGSRPRGRCSVCGTTVAVTRAGNAWWHESMIGVKERTCAGAGLPVL